MVFDPVPRNLDTPAQPDLVVALDVVDKTRERRSPARASGQPGMKPH